eukprot:CCRYP_006439-RC/>CCRYP_006439-RC protein AED:0.47 eAED:1.00 QI:0/-1/0/1/-1/0/1/0/8
MAPASGGG